MRFEAALDHLRRRLVLTGIRHPVVKIHGQQRTGTNFMHQLMKQNAPGVISPWPEEGGWKHGEFEPHRRWRYLVVARHPIAWLESFHDWEVAHSRSTCGSLADFLRSPLTAGPLVDAWGTSDPVELYNVSYSSWLTSSLTSAIVRYEDLVEDLSPTMARLFEELDLAIPASFADIEERADLWETAIVRRPLNRERSLHGWHSVVTAADLDHVRSLLPAKLLDQLSYQL